MAVTMKDIALKSGVSRPVVSIVLNNRAKELRISDEATQKVLQAAKELGYCRNELARSMVTGKSRIIAFVTCNMGVSTYTGKIQRGLWQAASTKDYSIKLYNLENNYKKILKNIREWQVEGVVFHVSNYSAVENLSQELHKLKIPTSFVNLLDTKNSQYNISTDDQQGAFEATNHLISQGAKKLLCITYKDSSSEYITQRIKGFFEAIKNVNYSILSCEHNSFSAIKAQLERDKFDAVFAISDFLAMQCMKAAYQLNLKIPHDFLLAGFGDLDMVEVK